MNKKESDIVNLPVEDATYTAQYEIRTCTVKFYGLDNTLIKSYEDIEIGSHVKVPGVPEVEHYTFTGWNPPIVVDAEGYTGAIMKSMDYYAEYTKTLFTLTFNSNGGTYVEPITQEYGTKVTVPKPTREGYTIVGWDPALPSTMPAYDMTFTANWIKYDSQIDNVVTTWGEEKVGINTGVYPTINTRIDIVASDLYGEGDIFVGIAKDGTIQWKNDNGDNPDNSDWRLFMHNGSIYWDFGNSRKQINYTDSKCRYSCSSKGFEVYDEINKNLVYSDVNYYCTSINVSNYPIWIAPRTYREHYATYYNIKIYEGDELLRHYIPWVDKDGVVCFKEKISNTLCYPQVGTWKSTNHHTFTFKSNGGTDVAEIKEYYGTAIVAPSDPTREGYTFIGWDKEIPSTMPDYDIIFTAQWQINQHTFTFNTIGGQYIAPIIQDYGTEVTAPDPTRKGYHFMGWDKQIPEFMPNRNMTFTANWKKIK